MIDVAVIEGDAADCELIARFVAENVPGLHTRRVSGSALFDDVTDTWLLDDVQRARMVIDARVLHQQLTPNYAGSNEFEGPSFHRSASTAFDAHGKRIAVIGERAAHVVGQLTKADLKLFNCPATWQTRKTKRRWVPRITLPKRQPQLIPAEIAGITPSGVRTVDGAEHSVDAIVYAAGCSAKNGIPDNALVGVDGLTIQQAWRDGAVAYLGIAVHGFPNYFMLSGPDSPALDAQLRYIFECLSRMRQKGSTRIEVRRSAQQQFIQRARITPPSRAFDFTKDEAPYEIYDGPATLTVGDIEHEVRVRLTGHLDAIDGRYHWQGTVFAATEELPSRPVKLAIDSLTAQARIAERTPWGSYSIAGVGAPPFELG